MRWECELAWPPRWRRASGALGNRSPPFGKHFSKQIDEYGVTIAAHYETLGADGGFIGPIRIVRVSLTLNCDVPTKAATHIGRIVEPKRH